MQQFTHCDRTREALEPVDREIEREKERKRINNTIGSSVAGRKKQAAGKQITVPNRISEHREAGNQSLR